MTAREQLPALIPDSAEDRNTQWSAVIVLALATLIIASEMTMAAFALPLISADFAVAPETTAWVLLAYSLPMVALAIPAGRWADGADIRLVFLLSLVLVAIASILAALAPSYAALMVSRVMLGLASALYLAVYMPVVSLTVKMAQRGRAISMVATIMMLGSVALAPLGGWVADHLGWRMVFLVKLPLLVLVLWLGYRVLPRKAGDLTLRQRLPCPDQPMLWETLLIGAALSAVLMAFEVAAQQRLLAASLITVGVAILFWWSRLAASRTLLTLVRRPGFGLPALSLLLIAALIGLISFTLPFFVVEVMGRGSQTLSLAVLGFVIAGALMSPLAGILADRYGALNIASLGAGLTVLGLLTLLQLDAQASVAGLTARTALVGGSMAIFNAPVMATLMAAAPSDRMGTASGLASVARTLGSIVGPAVAALAWTLSGGGVAGLHSGVLALAAMALVGCVALIWARLHFWLHRAEADA